MNNSVSVIIPNYNNAEYIESAIISCFHQGLFLREVIVVDDMSTDGSFVLLTKLAKKYSDKLSIYANPKKGGNNARNYGFSKSSGSYIQWLDADDELLPGKFSSQLSVFEENSEADVIYSDWYMDFYDSSESLERREEKRKSEYEDFVYEILADNWSVPANYLFKREIAFKLDRLRAWNPLTRVAQDREYVTTAAFLGANFIYAPGFYSIYNRRERESVSSMGFKKRLRYQLNMESEFRKIVKEKKYSPENSSKYISTLNSHAMNACFYAPGLTIKYPFLIFDIDWSIIHYKKYPVIPLIYFWQHLKYFSGYIKHSIEQLFK